MFDIGWQELFLIAVVAIVVIGPKELPRTLRAVMGIIRKGRMMARDFQDGLNEVVRQADLDDIKKEFDRTTHEIADTRDDLRGDLNLMDDDLHTIGKDLDKTATSIEDVVRATGEAAKAETTLPNDRKAPADPVDKVATDADRADPSKPRPAEG